MPDEVLIFHRGDHRDRALLLYSMLCAVEPFQMAKMAG